MITMITVTMMKLEWCDGYQNRKAEKAKIKEELLPILWIGACQKTRKGVGSNR